MKQVLVIALATFREAVRARVFVYLLVLAAFIVVGAIPASGLGIGQEIRLVTDLSMGGASLTAAFLAIFLGVASVSGEIERRTVYTVVTKAVSRAAFVAGKWLGVWAVVSVAAMISYGLVISVVSVLDKRFASELFAPLWMLIFEMGLLVALATFFSCITSPLLSSGFTLGIYLVGSSLSSLLFWIDQQAPGWFKRLCQALFVVLPDFEIYDIKSEVLYHLPYASVQLLSAAGYGLIYSAALLGLGALVFERRDLK